MADADDTAKTILSLNLLGRTAVRPDKMIEKFDNGAYFQTFAAERNPSFSANCNVLNSLLHVADPGTYVEQISRVAGFLCDAWYNGTVKDKWVCAKCNLRKKHLFH
jgi:hypothetical protein